MTCNVPLFRGHGPFVRELSGLPACPLWSCAAQQTESSPASGIHHLKPSGNYMYHLRQQSGTLNFIFVGFLLLNSIIQFTFVIVMCSL
jgi:hypothetical protein